MAVAVLLNFLRHRSIHPATKNLIGQTFDASTFAASALVVWGILDPAVLRLIGNTTPFLVIGAAAGIAYSVGELFPRATTGRSS